MGSGIRKEGKKSYAILRYQKEIMEHLQVCSVCSEFVLGCIKKWDINDHKP